MHAVFAPVEDILTRRDTLLRNTEPTAVGTPYTADPASDATVEKVPTPKIETTIPKGSFVFRPNGEKYVVRKFQGTTDIDFLRAARANKKPVLLTSCPGTGKTAMMEAAFTDLVTVMGSAETEAADFIGSWIPMPDGKYEWIDGPLLVAMEKGEPLFIDEIALVDSRSLAVVYSVMDGRKTINVTANPARGSVEAKDGFIVMAACNPNVPGAVMSDALLSRFLLKIEVTTDWDLAKTLGVPLAIINIAKNLDKKRLNGNVTAAPQLRELLAYRDIYNTFGKEVADANFVSTARPEDLAVYKEYIPVDPLTL